MTCYIHAQTHNEIDNTHCVGSMCRFNGIDNTHCVGSMCRFNGIDNTAVADLESFVGGVEHLLAPCGRWSLSKRRNSGSRSRSVVIHVVSRLCLVTIST